MQFSFYKNEFFQNQKFLKPSFFEFLLYLNDFFLVPSHFQFKIRSEAAFSSNV